MNDEATNQTLRIWDALAAGYDKHRILMNELERPVTERMFQALDVRAGDRILNLTAGPGEEGMQLASQSPEATVIISDFAPSMVAVSEKASKERGLMNVECRVIDAQAIDLENHSVDGVMSRYGLMLVPDIAKALGEIRRVLKPGRTLSYAVWGPLVANPWMMMMGATLMQRGHFTPPPGGGFFPLTSEQENQDAAIAAGFSRVEVDVIDHPHVHPNFESYWQISTECSGPLVEIINGLSSEERQSVHDQVQEYSASFRKDAGSYEFPSQRILVKAS